MRQNLKQPSNLIPKIVNNTLAKVNSAAASSVANFAQQMLPQPLRNSPVLGFILAFTISIGIGYAFYRVAIFQLRGSKKKVPKSRKIG